MLYVYIIIGKGRVLAGVHFDGRMLLFSNLRERGTVVGGGGWGGGVVLTYFRPEAARTVNFLPLSFLL